MANPVRQPAQQFPTPSLERAPTIGQIAEFTPASSAGALTAILLATLGMVAFTFVLVTLFAPQ
jgi:hypothetical protein